VFARAHPHLYRLMTDQPLPASTYPPAVEDRAAAPLQRAAGSRRARAVFAFAHGMVLLELTGRIPPDDPDHAWKEGVTAFQARGRPATPKVTSAVTPAHQAI
jgi:Tetracyclin repressor-like, C-terminal domain